MFVFWLGARRKKKLSVKKSHGWCRKQDLQGLITIVRDTQTRRIINNLEDRAAVESKLNCLLAFAT